MPDMNARSVAFVLPSLGKGGAQRATISLVNYLASQDGYKLYLIALKSDEVEFDIHSGVTVVHLDCASFKKSLMGICKILKRIQPDTVYSALWHINFLVVLCRAMLLVSSRMWFKHIASVHNNPDRIIQTENRYLSRFYYYVLARFSTKIVAVSKGIHEHLINKCHLSRRKVVLAYNPSITAQHKKFLDAESDIPFVKEHEGKYLLWVGRFDYQKDPIKFLEIVKITGLPAVLAGEGPLKEEIVAFIKNNDLQDKVLLLPFQENVMTLMAKAFLLVMTSRFEGFGLVLVESLYAGTPVISTDCKYGPSEIIDNGKNGLLVGDQASAETFSDAINTLITNPKMYLLMKNSATGSVDQYKDQVVFREYQEILGG
jgi:glycosyltransferase involved in cell wall biosynthesis